MSVFLQATIEVHAAGMEKFMGAMAELVPIVEDAGWKLRGAFVSRTGRVHTVIDLWELDDYNHMDRGMKALAAHPRFSTFAPVIAETVKNETLVFMDKAPYMR